jgi:hypothetical protein
VPKKKKTAEEINQPTGKPVVPLGQKKISKRQTPRRAAATKKPAKSRDTTERTAQVSASPAADVTAVTSGLSDDAVRLRAYFISERRHRFALPGDAESDWLEAKRQLLAEARR